MIPEYVETTVIITQPHSERTWHATLPNGRPVLAFRDEGEPLIELVPGQSVAVQMTVSDFSRALVLV